MAAAFEHCVKLKLDDAPNWLSHIEITRTGDTIEIEVIKENGTSQGSCQMSTVAFNNMADYLLTAPQEKEV